MNEIEFENKLVGLKPKYQEQFKKIYESNEEFKGDFNIMAFLFGVYQRDYGLYQSLQF